MKKHDVFCRSLEVIKKFYQLGKIFRIMQPFETIYKNQNHFLLVQEKNQISLQIFNSCMYFYNFEAA
jgi:hypothetical protein